jgi:hypothetical protein
MSVPAGTLTDDYRTRLLEFYGRMLGWTEIKSLRLPDRLTLAIGRNSYVNLRERTDSMVTHGYDHFGVLLPSASEMRELWERLAAEPEDVHLEPFTPNDEGEGSFRFRYLLPLAVEPQFYESLL